MTENGTRDDGRRIRISQCMIVKNEEQHIERALTWAKNIAEEQIVVDTGSTDQTVAIAEKLGAKVFRFSWVDDFSAAKNFAIDHASGNWIVFLDADEWCTEEEAAKIPAIIQKAGDHDMIFATRRDLSNAGETIGLVALPRIFRNEPEMRYLGRIHETLGLHPEQESAYDAGNELEILHDGYQREAMPAKIARNLFYIRKALEENPRDGMMLGYLGDTYASQGEWEKAEEAFCACVRILAKQVPTSPQRMSSSYTQLMRIAMREENARVRAEKLAKYYQCAVRDLPLDPDFDYFLAGVRLQGKKYGEAISLYGRALQKLGHAGSQFNGLECKTHLPDLYDDYAYALLMDHSEERAAAKARELLQLDRYRWRTLLLFLSAGRQNVGRKDIESLYDLSVMKDRMFLIKAAQCTHREDLLAWLMQGMTREEQETIRNIFSIAK